MKYLLTFHGTAIISRIDSHTYFDWVFYYYYSGEEENRQFVFTRNYQIENIWLEELIKRHLILEVVKRDPTDKKFFQEKQKFLMKVGNLPCKTLDLK